MTTRLARLQDAENIADLLIANSADNGGELYGNYSVEVVAEWIERATPTLVALDEGRVIGVLFTAEKARVKAKPVVEMLKVWPGDADAYLYGPVCIDVDARGQTDQQQKRVFTELYRELKQQFPTREGLLFINTENTRSIAAHQRLGMTRVADFTCEGTQFVVMTV
ncbi:hypothetical protein ED28_01495 [[Pantoea] beijingensis]|uniref:N-acetyltransferase n=1 Tax=[Pantoea] beijingensis TaxID=1324864 RepID=A0A443II42_9GAMM|nr:hypothetical protein ED28_01495 [[Pantoea] beijingensis]